MYIFVKTNSYGFWFATFATIYIMWKNIEHE